MAENLNNGSGSTNAGSPDPSTETKPEGWKDEYRSYERQMPKKYWGHPYFQSKDTLDAALDGLLNPAKKAPESYALDAVDENQGKTLSSAFKELDLTQEQAKKVNDIYKDMIPKKPDYEDLLNKKYGTGRADAESMSDKALKAFLPKEAYESVKKADFSKNPDFVEFARLVGKNVGDDSDRHFGASTTQKRNMFSEFAKGTLK